METEISSNDRVPSKPREAIHSMPAGEPGPIFAVTFILELPFDLGLREQSGGLLLSERGSEWDGWPDDAIRTVVSLPADVPLSADVGPGTRWTLRRGWVDSHVPLLAADEAFSDWVEPLESPQEHQRRQDAIRDWRERGIRKPVTIAALTRFVGWDGVPKNPEDPRTLALYEMARTDFNRILGILGLTTGVWWVAPVTDRELPGMVPVIAEFAGPHDTPPPGESARRRGGTFPLHVHDLLPNLPDQAFVSDQQFEAAGGLLQAFNRGDLAFLPVFELLHEAGGDLNVGKPGQAIVLSSAAVELALSVLLCEGSALAGWSTTEFERATRSSFRGRIEHHVAKLLDITIDVQSGEDAWARWWRSGYQVRNDFAHEAKTPTRDEALAAWQSVLELFRELRSTLAAHPVLHPLTDHMPFWAEIT
ncbi:hypothetical protein [Conexibacter sp. CPCC 206217]|uniref:hypothetical protein n=1 Tax=Conexibacter sp. CPCC 206217 TaxID=3064574 RepID=UPI0027242E79|nr:hypothetical protein [Conexibacter sp. CPCC 206217]MDO8211016.1 hypothetical protein [Conexibacter sp. CPCC 206217]